MNLFKKYNDIGISYKLDARQTERLRKYREKQQRSQHESVVQSQLNDAAFVHSLNEDEKFVWDDELKEIAHEEIICVDILTTTPVFREKKVRIKVLPKLVEIDLVFEGLEPQPLLKQFYNDHNKLLKKMNEGLVEESTLNEWESKIFQYINDTAVFQQITSLHSEQS